jgi:hypothetical protein
MGRPTVTGTVTAAIREDKDPYEAFCELDRLLYKWRSEYSRIIQSSQETNVSS